MKCLKLCLLQLWSIYTARVIAYTRARTGVVVCLAIVQCGLRLKPLFQVTSLFCTWCKECVCGLVYWRYRSSAKKHSRRNWWCHPA